MNIHMPIDVSFPRNPIPANLKEINAEELARWQRGKTGGVYVLDVREVEEIAEGTVLDAQTIPLGALARMHDELDRGRTYVILCRSGKRSAQACTLLQSAGFADVYNLRGGINAWVLEGFPLVLPAKH